jgi:Multiple antibiotic transporter
MVDAYQLAIATISVATQLFAVIDPIGAVPLLFNVPDYERRITKISRLIGVAVPIILLVFALVGPYIFSIFGININDFNPTGRHNITHSSNRYIEGRNIQHCPNKSG